MTLLLISLAVPLLAVAVIYADVYWWRSYNVLIPAQGLRWHDNGKWYTIPPAPWGRDLRVEFGHWFFWFPFMQGYFGANDRVCTAVGKRPNAATLCHEVWHACYESPSKGLRYLPWYLFHMRQSEAAANGHMRERYLDRWYQQAAAYLLFTRTTGRVGEAL